MVLLVVFSVLAGCTSIPSFAPSNPCDPLYEGDEVCPWDDDEGADSGPGEPDAYPPDAGLGEDAAAPDSVEDGGGDDAGLPVDGCLCSVVSACCDGCEPVNPGGECGDDDGLRCTEGRCDEAGDCAVEVLEGWCLVDDVCHHTDTDPSHCGECGTACRRDLVCHAGECVVGCPVGFDECGGGCFDLSVDRENCGGCGVWCAAGQECAAGICGGGCGDGETACGGVCVSLASDAAHCGECNNACGAGASCEAGQCVVRVTGVTLSPQSMALGRGETGRLAATISPVGASDQAVVWSSTAPALASVDEGGLVTGVGEGSATVTAVTVDGGHTASAQVVVVVRVEAVVVEPAQLSLRPDETHQLQVTVEPADASDRRVLWSSDTPGVASVTNTGLVSAHSVGAARISATSISNGAAGHTDLTVVGVPVTGVSLSPATLNLVRGQSGVLLQATVEPTDATDTRLMWSSAEPGIAGVTTQGVVTPHAGGQTVVTATTVDGGHQARCTVNVRVPVEGVALAPDSLLIAPGGGSALLTATVSPAEATDQSVTWSTADPTIATVATVSTDGLSATITGGAAGHTSVTVRTADGGHTASAAIRVAIPVASVTIDQGDLFVMPGHTAPLSATVLPSDATDPGVDWTSADDSVATVDRDGVVTGLLAGSSTTISVLTVDGGYRDSITVRVGVYATGVTISPGYSIVLPGESGHLTATITPPEASDKSVSWSSSHPEVATVDGAGVVTGVDMGVTTISATTTDGGHDAQATVQVAIPISAITISPGEVLVLTGESVQLDATLLPEDSTDTNITWSSSAAGVASVDSTGLVAGHAEGQVTITATADLGGVTGEALVRVVHTPDDFVWIEPGTFWMGSPNGNCPSGFTDYLGGTGRDCMNEANRDGMRERLHQVNLSIPFMMQIRPVTQAQYLEVLSAPGNNPQELDTHPSNNFFRANNPAENVTWHQALAYANAMSRLGDVEECYDCEGSGDAVVCSLKDRFPRPQACKGYRLPTEAEWEYSARAGSVAPFHTTTVDHPNTTAGQQDALNSAGWHFDNVPNWYPQPVMGKTPNAWGIYDMHGNIYEWTWDWYVADRTRYTNDPSGPATGEYRIVKGRHAVLSGGRAALRNRTSPETKWERAGFRLARSI